MMKVNITSSVRSYSYYLNAFVWFGILRFTNCSNYAGSIYQVAGCFAFIVFWMSFYYKCPVALPHSAVGWSAVCDCGIS